MTTLPIPQLAPQLAYLPQSQADPGGAARLPAPAGAAARFEQLVYSPAAAGRADAAHAALSSSAIGNGGLQHYLQQLSHRWDAGQNSLKKLADTGQFTTKELVLTQMQIINCALDVEVSSKCASMFENGVQTLIQRGS